MLQACPLMHWARVRRHDRICGRLRRLAKSKGWMVVEEPNLRLRDGQLGKPNHILLKGSAIIINDVAVSWEGPRPLDSTYKGKIDYYSQPDVLGALRERYPGRDFRVTALVLRVRGTWCPRNREIVDVLGLSRRECSTLVTNVINGSILVHKNFMSAVGGGVSSSRGMDTRQPAVISHQ